MSNTRGNSKQDRRSARKARLGFSLLELMVAMGVFLIMGGAVVSLMRRHVPLFNTAQNQAGLNITLRNAVAQLQMEVVNAGSSYSAANPMPFWPIGATITTAATPGCNATRNYVSTCFDQLFLIDADSNLPALAPSQDAAGTVTVDTNANATVFLTFPGNPAAATTAQYDAWAAALPAGTELMLVQGGTDMVAGQPSITVVVVGPGNAARSNNSVAVPITTTGSIQCPPGSPTAVTMTGIPAPAADPMQIYAVGECLRFTSSFNPQLDYAIKLNATSYSVDGTDIRNPKLIRTNPNGAQDVIAEQIVGFNVGAWSSITGAYSTDPTTYNSDWASIRSLQIQLIARAAPNVDNGSAFQNTYDQGPYQVQGVSVVINPRNLNTN